MALPSSPVHWSRPVLPLPIHSGTALNEEIGDIDQTELCSPVQRSAARPIQRLNFRTILDQDTRYLGVRGEVEWRIKPLGTTGIDLGSPADQNQGNLRQSSFG